MNIPKETHRRNLLKIVDRIKALGKRRKEIEEILHTFSTKSWEKLSLQEKGEHTFLNCKPCTSEKYNILTSAFAVKVKACTHMKQKPVNT